MTDIASFSREISIGTARENGRDCKPLSFDVLLLENFERISISHPDDLAFPLIHVILYFLLPYENQITDKEILVCRPNRLHVPKNVIKTSCCKMRHARASHLMSSFLLFNRDSSILIVILFRFRRQAIYYDIRHE